MTTGQIDVLGGSPSTLALNNKVTADGLTVDGESTVVISSDGDVTISGATIVGDTGGLSTLMVTGALVTDTLDIAAQIGSRGALDVNAGTVVVNSDSFSVGLRGDGTAIIQNGGTLIANGSFHAIGHALGANGAMTISGDGSQLLLAGDLSVGQGSLNLDTGFGTLGATTLGTLDVLDGGQILIDDPAGFGGVIVGSEQGASGVVNVNGAGSRIEARGLEGSFFNVGEEGASGEATIVEGGLIDALFMTVGRNPGSTGSVVIDGENDPDGFTSTLRLEGTDLEGFAAFLTIGRSAGIGSISVAGGGLLSISSETGIFPGVNLGGNSNDPGGMGTLAVTGLDSLVEIVGDGATMNVGSNQGVGIVQVTQGGVIEIIDTVGDPQRPANFDLGNNAGATGSALVDGAGSEIVLSGVSGIEFTGSMDIGRAGSGFLTITDGGRVANDPEGITTIARETGSVGTVSLVGRCMGQDVVPSGRDRATMVLI